jgi:hypothetical protein
MVVRTAPVKASVWNAQPGTATVSVIAEAIRRVRFMGLPLDRPSELFPAR